MSDKYRTAEVLVGEIKAALEKTGVKFRTDTEIAEVLLVALAVLKGDDPAKTLPGLVGGDSAAVAAAMHEVPEGKGKQVLTKALAEHGGNYRNALVATQKQLLQPLLAEGLTVKAASERLAPNYPGIF